MIPADFAGAIPRICRRARTCRGVISSRCSCERGIFTSAFPCSAPRISHRKFAGYLSKNPVNLSDFIEIYGNSLDSGRADRLRHHTEIPSWASPANTGKCVRNPRSRVVEKAGCGGSAEALAPSYRAGATAPYRRFDPTEEGWLKGATYPAGANFTLRYAALRQAQDRLFGGYSG